MYFVYVLKSQKTNSLYKGQTANLEKRLLEHNIGKVKSTKAFIPWKIAYYEEFTNREDAVKREKYLKSGIGRQFLRDIIESG